jgi:hypothetical protein
VFKIVLRKAATLAHSPRRAVGAKLVPWRQQRARQFLQDEKVWPLLTGGDAAEAKPEAWDLAFLYRLVRTKRPDCVLEFGSGFSTIAIAEALSRNGTGRLYSLETSERWAANTARKLPQHLRSVVDLRPARAEITVHNGQVCSFYRELPNIDPQIVYLDGPDPMDVEGAHRGIAFPLETAANRSIVAADILLYEFSFAPGATIVIDGRANNVAFLCANLKRRWRLTRDRAMKHSVMRLIE